MHIPFNFVDKLAKIFPFKRTYSSKAKKKIFCIFLTETIHIPMYTYSMAWIKAILEIAQFFCWLLL